MKNQITITRVCYILSFTLLTGMAVSCGGKPTIKALLGKQTPYEKYVQSLRLAKLHQSGLGMDWLEAGTRVLQDSLLLPIPFEETGYFRAEKPTAFSYNFKARQGESIRIAAQTKSREEVKLFLDLFEVENGYPRKVRHLESADTTSLQINFRVKEDLTYLVRLQPELLRSGSYTISISSQPSLGFPVQGKGNSAIQSVWGQVRDNGARRHEGIDIFASRGTPAIAATKGTITRVDETPIGGKVVWLSDDAANQHIYYAHLDTQLVQAGQQVVPGQVLGLVGNTGNARTTSPHLHFGIYRFGHGAVDPYPFVYTPTQKAVPLQVNTTQLGKWARTSKKEVNMRLSPDKKAVLVTTLDQNTALQIVGGTANWYRVQLPTGLEGYIQANFIESLQKPLRNLKISANTEVLEEPLANGTPIDQIKANSDVTVLANYSQYLLIKTEDGTLGWLQVS
ncbi:M23 family metallopeptidase [Adhaeribacter radiodurans]|uniref:M23 family metallopeptidase n=1 Tax=Adhaeribacter radiodurans TaxID=2745197 RepID=A0A7L7LAD0_9BACT|nr:M23 family metallopeptidase [Adhaeribacter radiodurans]QMU29788.1 M23 family metallopeptidase [Adhaeribacter radiodurans]